MFENRSKYLILQILRLEFKLDIFGDFQTLCCRGGCNLSKKAKNKEGRKGTSCSCHYYTLKGLLLV